jgi:ethanolamine ammonia-lyase small subunit
MKPLNWLGEFTAARVALGRQLSTRDWLALREAHAEARDAIQSAITWPAGIPVVASQCRDRNEYLLRPDAGRRLDPGADLPGIARGADVLLAVVDGLSPLAVTRYAAAVVEGLRRELAGLDVAGSVGVARGRVAIGDELGERLGARLVAVLIGERPGLSAADSLGIYLTYEPRIGRTDA